MEQLKKQEHVNPNIEKDYILFLEGTEFSFNSFDEAINFVAQRCHSCNTIISEMPIYHLEKVFCGHSCISNSP